MVESSEPSRSTTAAGPETPAGAPSLPPAPRDRLTAVLIGVGITAGVVFIVALVFFSGFVLGRNVNSSWHRGYDEDRTEMSGTCPMMSSGGQMPMGPGGQMPMGPGQMPMGPAMAPGGGPGPGGGMGPGGTTDPHHPPTPTSATPRP